MPNPYFEFKQFTVYHDHCAMKVGTDGVLLGAWTNIDDTSTILDIGAGSGLISLMLAQRAPSVQISSIEIDEAATMQANDNYMKSHFNNILSCENISLQDFVKKNSVKFDLIVSNPPFFSQSLKSPNEQRTKARHSDSLSIEELIGLSTALLSNKGKLNLIYPSSDKDHLLDLAKQNKIFVTRITNVYPTPNSKSKRVLLELSKEEASTEISDLIIETSRHEYSLQFIGMVKDFYLKL